jgi:hypothetical protein
MQAVSITESDGRLQVASPYSDAFVAGAKPLGGRWDPAARVWSFDPRDADRVAALIEQVYGYNAETADEPTVTVRVDAWAWSQSSEIVLAGQRIAHRPGRDMSVRLGDGVVCVTGRFPGQGGSVRNPRIGENDAVLEVRDVPVSVARRMAEGQYVTIPDAETERQALVARRERLVAELAAIDAELAADGLAAELVTA